MKILVISNLFPPHTIGGYEIACEAFVRRFSGDDLTILTTAYGVTRGTVEGDVARILPNMFGRYPELDAAPPRRMRRLFNQEVFTITREWIRKTRPDLCYIWNLARLSLAPIVAARLASLPVVYHFEDTWLPDIGFHPRTSIQHAKYVVGAPFTFPGRTGAIFVSNFLQGWYAARRFAFSRNAVVHNGVAGDFGPPEHSSLPGHPLRLMYVGRLVPEKGVDTLLEALRLAQHAAPGTLSLTIVGSGPISYVDDLKHRSAVNRLDVHWLGWLDRSGVARTYMEHDVAVVPSFWDEPFGLVAIEAMAAGLPVVATLSGGLQELVLHDVTGLLVPRDDPRSLSDALLRLANEPDMCRRLGRQAVQVARESFNMDRQAQLARRFIDDVAGS